MKKTRFIFWTLLPSTLLLLSACGGAKPGGGAVVVGGILAQGDEPGETGGAAIGPKIDAEGWGGTGKLLASKNRLLNRIRHYRRNGVGTVFCRDTGLACRQRHDEALCDEVHKSGDDVDAIEVCRQIFAAKLGDYETFFTSKTPIEGEDNPTVGGAAVQAFVNKTFDRVVFRKDFVEKASDEELDAKMLHEASHIVFRDNDDRDVPGFGKSGPLYDRIAAAAQVDPMLHEDEYRSVVLSHPKLLAFYRLDDPEGTALAWDWKNGEHGSYNGGTPTWVPSLRNNEIASIGGALDVPSGGARVHVPADRFLNLRGPMTAEFWMEWTGNSNARMIQFPNYMLYGFSDHAGVVPHFGFGLNDGDLLGVEGYRIRNGWLQVVAVFDPNATGVGGDREKLYLNGQPMPLYTRRGPRPAAPAGELGAMIFGNLFNGRLDDLSLYDGVMSAADVKLHYEAGSGRRSFGGTVATTVLAGQAVTQQAPVTLPERCPNARIITSGSAAFGYCGTATAAGPCRDNAAATTSPLWSSVSSATETALSLAATSYWGPLRATNTVLKWVVSCRR